VARVQAAGRGSNPAGQREEAELCGAEPLKAGTVRVQCLGRLELLVDGRPVRWPTKKTVELFAYLLHNNGRFVSKDRIVDDLWPDQGYENALVNLHTAV
jgi:two-component SAPR family response regulator